MGRFPRTPVCYTLLHLIGVYEDGESKEQKTEEGQEWTHHNATETEDVGVETTFYRASASGHK